MEHDLTKWSGYPMLLTEKGKVTGQEANLQIGDGVVTCNSLIEINVGDELKLRDSTHVVTDVVESRPAKGNHPEEGVLFHSLKTTFKKYAQNV